MFLKKDSLVLIWLRGEVLTGEEYGWERGGWNDAATDAGMPNRSGFPVKTSSHQPDSCVRSAAVHSRLHVQTHTGVRTVPSGSDCRS